MAITSVEEYRKYRLPTLIKQETYIMCQKELAHEIATLLARIFN